jgi:MFS family permease
VDIGFIFSVYAVVKAIVEPIFGRLIEKTGWRFIMYSGLILEVRVSHSSI